MNSLYLRRHRAGSIIVLAAALMVVMIGILAFAVDLGYLQVVRTEFQRTADAAALAAVGELTNTKNLDIIGSTNFTDLEKTALNTKAYNKSVDYNQLNQEGRISANLAVDNVNVWYRPNPPIPNYPLNSYMFTVTVQLKRTAAQNKEVPLFFGRVLGVSTLPVETTATAAFKDHVFYKGVGDALPFTLDLFTWYQLMQGHGSDDWTWDPVEKRIKTGPDGILEVNLYPQGNGSPGNRGTLKIGDGNGNSGGVPRIRRQITDGLTAEDLAPYGGKLQLNSEGNLYLDGDPGISGGMENALAEIIGQPRVVPLFHTVHGSGSNAVYTIVQFAGIRIMEVKLSGSMSSKRVIIQPAFVPISGGIPSNTPTSTGLYDPSKQIMLIH
jgi:Flp pilus assembly protein TadG